MEAAKVEVEEVLRSAAAAALQDEAEEEEVEVEGGAREIDANFSRALLLLSLISALRANAEIGLIREVEDEAEDEAEVDDVNGTGGGRCERFSTGGSGGCQFLGGGP